MFEEKVGKWLDGRKIKSVDTFETVEGMHDQVGVHFDDEKQPSVQAISIGELQYLTFDTEEESIKNRSLSFNVASEDAQRKIMDAIRHWNPKFKELKRMLDNIQESLHVVKTRFDRAVFGGESGEYDELGLKLSTIIETIKRSGKEVDYSGFTDLGKRLFLAMIESDISYRDALGIVPSMAPPINKLFNEACEYAVGIPSNEVRVAEVIQFAEAYEETHGEPKELKEEIKPAE